MVLDENLYRKSDNLLTWTQIMRGSLTASQSQDLKFQIDLRVPKNWYRQNLDGFFRFTGKI